VAFQRSVISLFDFRFSLSQTSSRELFHGPGPERGGANTVGEKELYPYPLYEWSLCPSFHTCHAYSGTGIREGMDGPAGWCLYSHIAYTDDD